MNGAEFRGAAQRADTTVALQPDEVVDAAAAVYDRLTAALAGAGVVDADVEHVFAGLLPAHLVQVVAESRRRQAQAQHLSAGRG